MRPLVTVSLLGVLPVLLLSCKDDEFALGRNRQVDTYYQSPAVEADVLFIVDNSSSMRSTQEKLTAAFDAFIVGLEDIESDFHIGITTTDVSADGERGQMIEVVDPATFQPSPYITRDMEGYQDLFRGAVDAVGTSGDVFEAGLESASLALLPESRGGVADTLNAGFLRDGAKLAVVWISDEDDCSQDGTLPLSDPDECYAPEYASSLVPVQEFVTDYLSLKYRNEDVVLGAIVGISRSSDACEGVSVARGDRYIAAVELVGGVVGDICDGSFDDIMEELGVNAAGQRTVFQLSKTPDPTTIEVYLTVGDETEPTQVTTGWTYLADANAISFYGESIPPRDSEIQISYVIIAN